jgi:UDP-2,3-diacylglucosamine hydrolase
MEKKIYFASDFHFGIPDRDSSVVREKLFVKWLDEVKQDASEIYLMGDLFDFWFEYKTVVPKGYVRLLGKLTELIESGIRIHLFKGNHDMWAFDYLPKEVGIQIHRDPEVVKFGDKVFYLAHGDGLGPGDHGYKFIKKVFQCRFNQWLFRIFHPDFGIRLGLFWSRKSRKATMSRENRDEHEKRMITERLTVHSSVELFLHPEIDFFVYGHLHYPWDQVITGHSRQISLGDWITNFTYAVFDGEELKLLKYQ